MSLQGLQVLASSTRRASAWHPVGRQAPAMEARWQGALGCCGSDLDQPWGGLAVRHAGVWMERHFAECCSRLREVRSMVRGCTGSHIPLATRTMHVCHADLNQPHMLLPVWLRAGMARRTAARCARGQIRRCRCGRALQQHLQLVSSGQRQSCQRHSVQYKPRHCP